MRTHTVTWFLLALLAAGVWANLLRAGSAAWAQTASADRTAIFDEITVKRINFAISNNSGAASVVLNDPQGRPRIRLSVDDAATARIEVLDEDGKPVFAAPP